MCAIFHMGSRRLRDQVTARSTRRKTLFQLVWKCHKITSELRSIVQLTRNQVQLRGDPGTIVRNTCRQVHEKVIGQ